MYSDIIAPKKNSIRRVTRESMLEDVHEEQEIIYNGRPSREKKFPRFVLFLVIGLLLISGIIYAKFSERTVITFKPQTTTLDIRERIPLYLADTKTASTSDSLGYSLIYISSKTDRNPFVPTTQTAPAEAATKTSLTQVEIVATTTGAKMTVYVVNQTSASLSLRATTRFDVNGVIYSIENQLNVPVTKDVSAFTNSPKYYLPGFQGTADAKLIYAVADETDSATPTTATTSEVSKSTVPEDILSLLPEASVALRKNTIYDQSVGQTAVVTFDKQDLLAMLQKKSPAYLEYITAFKPLADIVTYKVQVVDYDIEASAESGRPTSFKKLILEITPVLDVQKTKTVFVDFSTDAMEKIQEQIAKYASFDVSNTPFWKGTVAEEGRVDVKIEE